MEDIEYLEEYEDLVLPALNSAAAAAAVSSISYQANKSAQNQKINDADDSSSSLDQDIFNCLFDDNSDDDFNEYENIDNETALKTKPESNEYYEALGENIDEIDKKVIEKVEIAQEDPINKDNTIAVNKTIPSTRKNKTFMTKTSGTTIPLNTSQQTAFINKSKSIATVRPTVQNQQQQENSNKKPTSLSSASSVIQEQPSTSAASNSSSSPHLPDLVHKSLPSASKLSSSRLISEKPAASNPISTTALKKVIKRPPTILRPEKIVTIDPPYDPLDIDDISEAVSGNDSLSDISGNTYNSISVFEDDESNDEYFSGDEDYYDNDQEAISSSSQVIELSNDSSSAPSNLEDFRAPTPSPVISDDSETRSSYSSLKISTIKSVKPYSHPDIIESVLRKGEKPKLLELLHKYNLLESSLETIEEDNSIIDITTSRENLVESLETQQDENLKSNPPPTTSTIDIVNISPTDNNKPLTLNSLNKNLTKSSKKTNKNKSKKKSVTDMDYRDLKSPGAVSTDSDLSAVEELLEESYAEAMKRVNDVPFTNQDVGAEVDIDGSDDITAIMENTQDLPKAGVVIDYEQNDLQIVKHNEMVTEVMQADQKNKELSEPEILKNETIEINEKDDVQIIEISEQTDCSLNQKGIVKEIDQTDFALKQEVVKEVNEPEKLLKTETKENNANSNDLVISQTDCSSRQEIVKEDDKELNEPEQLLKNETEEQNEDDDVEIIELSEQPAPSIKQEEIVKDNPEKPANDVKAIIPGSQESTKRLESVASITFNSPNARKKKRFRNLVTPEPTASETAMSIDDMKDFKGFEEEEEVRLGKSIEKSEKQKKMIQPAEETKEKQKKMTPPTEETKEKRIENKAEKDRPAGSFKSPSNSQQSSKDKSKESKGNTTRDSSKESKDKTARHSKSSRDSSKDRSSRETSRDKTSRESSKDRSRESSKDRSKRSHNEDSASKYHQRDHRKSSDSKGSSKSRESSKSRDSKDSRNIKTATEDSRRSTSIKRDLLSESSKDKSTANKDNKTKEIIKSNTDSKMAKEQHNKSKSADSKETKNIKMVTQESIKPDMSLEKSKEKSTENKVSKITESDNSKIIDKSSKESKISKEQDNKIGLKELKKSSSEISDIIAVDTVQNSKDKNNAKTEEPKDTHLSSSSADKANIKSDSSKELKIVKKIDLNKSSAEINKPDHSKSPKVSTNVNKSVANKPSSSGTAEVPKGVQEKNADKSKSTAPKKMTTNANDKSVSLKNTPDRKTIQNSKSSSTDLNTSVASSKSVEGHKKDPQKINKLSSSDTMINKIDGKTDKNTIDVNKIKPDMTTKTKNLTPLKQVPKEAVATTSNKNQPEGSHTKPSNSGTNDTSSSKAPLVQKTKTIIKSKEKSFDFKKPKEAEDVKTIKNINKDTSNISMSPKRSPKPKDDSIKSNEQENFKNTTENKQQPISKNLNVVASPKPDKIKTDENKTDDSKINVDLTADSETSKSDGEKKEHNSNKTTKNESEQKCSENEVSSGSKDPKETKVNKEDKNIESNYDSNITPSEEVIAINKTTNALIKEERIKQREKSKVTHSPKKEPKGKLIDKSKIPETSNKEITAKEMPKNKDADDPNKVTNEREVEKNKVPPTPKNEQKEKFIEKNKIQENNNKEQKGKNISKVKNPKTPNSDRNKRDVEKNKIPDMTSKEQKEKETSKHKDFETTTKAILGTLNQEETEKELDKLTETSDIKQNKKELEKPKVPEAPIKEEKGKETVKNKDFETPTKTILEILNQEQKGKELDKLTEASDMKQNKKELEKAKAHEAPIKQTKAKEAAKNKVVETLNKTQIAKEVEKNKAPKTPNKKQNEMNLAGNNDPETSIKEQKGKDSIKNKVPETTNKEQNKKEMETNRILESPNKDSKVKEMEKKEVPQTRNKEQSKKGKAKNKITETLIKEQTINATVKQKVLKISHKEEKEVDKNKIEGHNKEQKEKVTPKNNKDPQNSNKEQKEIQEITIIKDENDTSRSESLNDQLGTKTEKQIATNKAKMNDNKTSKQTEVSTHKSESSSKICKNVEKQHAKTVKDSVTDLEETKQIAKPPGTSEELNIKEIITTEEEKIELMTEKLSDHTVESKKISDSNKTDKDFVEIDRNQEHIKVKKSKGNVNEESKPNEDNINLSSDKKLNEMKTAESAEAVLKSRESPALKKSLKYNAANESEKIRTIMESVLEKSVVVVIEPLKSIPFEPRRTRSRMENPKLEDSIRKEELSKAEILENSETKKLKMSETSTLKNICINKAEKTASELHNTETFQRKDIKDPKSDIEVEKTIQEIPDICQDDLSKESKLSEGETSIADCIKEIEKEIVGPVKTRTRGDLKHETETDKNKTNSEMSEEKYSTQKETEKHFESKKPKRRTDHKAELKREKQVTPQIESSDEKTDSDTSKPINTRKPVDPQAEITKEVREAFTKETCEEKCSSSKQENEISETGNNEDLTDKGTEENRELRKTRRRVDIKEEELKGQRDSTDIELSGERKSTQKETGDHIEPIKIKTRSDLKTEAINEKTKITQVELSDDKSSTRKEIEPIKTRRRADINEEAVKGKSDILQVEPLNSNCSAPTGPIKIGSRGDLKEEDLKEEKQILEVGSLEDKRSEQKELKEHYEPPKTRRHGDVKAEIDKEKKETMQPELSKEKISTKKESEALKAGSHAELKDEALNNKPELSQVENLESVKRRSRWDLKVEPNKEKTTIAKVELSEEKAFLKNENEPVKTRRRGDLKEEIVKQKPETLEVDLSDDKCSTQKELKEEHHEPIKTRRRGDLKSESDKEQTQVGLAELSEEKSCNKRENDPVKTRIRGDLKEETVEKLKVALLDDKSSDKKELAQEHLDRAKSKRNADLKKETGKEKLQMSRGSPSGGKTSAQKESGKEISTPIKTKGAVKEITEISHPESSNTTSSVQENAKKLITDTITTRKCGETVNEKSSIQKCTVKTIIEQITPRRRGNPKGETEKSQQELTQKKLVDPSEKEVNFEPVAKRRRVDAKSESDKDEGEKSFAQETTEPVILEQVTTRSRGDPKREAEKDLLETSQVELTHKKLLDQKEQRENNFEPVTRRSRGDTKSEHGKSNETIVTETITTRSRGDPKKETEKAQLETSQVELTKNQVFDLEQPEGRLEHMTTRRRGDTKSETVKNKDEKSTAPKITETITVEQITTRSRGDPKGEAEKVQQKVSRCETSDKNVFDHKEPEDHSEPITTRRRGDTKPEVTKNKTEKTFDKKNTETIILEQEDQQEPSQIEDNFEPIATRRRGGIIFESGKDKDDENSGHQDEMSKVETCKEKCLVQGNIISQTEDHHFEPRRTRSRLDLKEEAGKEKDEISRKNLSLDKQSSDSKSRREDKNIRKESDEQIKIGGCKQIEENCETVKDHIPPQKDSQNQTEEKNSEPIKTRSRGEALKQTDTHSEGNEISKSTSTSHEQKALKTNFEIQKISEESVGSENEISGSESASSNSDYTFRRTLRNRITDSPFQQNDNKKTFKEPHLMPTTFVTPKSAKNENEITNVLSSITKRTLRSPAAETDSPSSTKKPKLETSKKLRFRNLHESFEEVEQPMAPSQPISKDPNYLQEQSALLDKQKLNEPSTTVAKKSTQNKNSIEIKETSKKVNEKVKDFKTSETSTNVHRKELDSEGAQEPSDKVIQDINIKQVDKSETNVQGSTIQPITTKPNIKSTANKSPGASVVISFSEWLKIKNQNLPDKLKDESATTKESTQDILNRQSRARSRLTPKVVHCKLTEDQTETIDINKASQAETTMICQDKEKVSGGSQTNSNIIETDNTSGVNDVDNILHESMDNSMPQLTDNKIQNDTKELSLKIKNKKSNVKRLQTSSKASGKSPKIEINKPKPNTPTRIKRNETALLIASMPKEMKDRGITDLLNTKAHIKRQRLPNKRLLNEGIELQKPSATEAAPTTRAAREKALAAPVVQFPNANVSQSPENLETQITAAKNMSKSPTRRTPKQNFLTMSQRDSSSASIEQVVTPIIARRSGDTEGLSAQMEKEATNLDTPIVVRSRKSMPILTKESLGKVPSVPSRKSLSIPKQQKEKNELSENSIFKMPKQAGSSTILNKIPISSDASIKKFYTDDTERPDSRIKIQQKENILKRFKCRKPYVRLDRSIVESYFKSIRIGRKQKLTRNTTAVKNVSEVPADMSSIIRNNSETSLRIQSVVDASNIRNTVSAMTTTDNQAREAISSRTNAFQDEVVSAAGVRNIQETYILPNVEGTSATLMPQISNAAGTNEIIELKHEFVDENPIGLINDAILPDTPTLLARAQTITEAAHHALSNSVTPTDIRLLTTDSSENNFVPSFGVTPRSLDNKGTCLYTFLHPAKYNRNHSNVLLDYCCPNLDGPMPAIDPTRIHAQVQIPIIELPASIVLTTKVVMRSDLESGNTTIPAIIRKKAEKIRKNMATHHKLAVTTTAANTQPTAPILPPMAQPNLASSPRPSLPPTINALTKQLPSTTTITAKVRPPIPQNSQIMAIQPPVHPSSSITASSVTSSYPKNTIVSVLPKGSSGQLSDTQQSILRSNLRRFDVLLKQLVQPYESLSFAERHRIIEAVIASENFLPKALDQTLLLMEEYIKQTILLKRNDSLKQPPSSSTSAIMSTNNYAISQASVASPLVTTQMPQLQPSPKILASNAAPVAPNTYSAQFEQMHSKKLQYRSKNSSSTSAAAGSSLDGALVKQRHVPIYDTERNIIGYQMQMAPLSPAYTKSTMSSNSGAVMSTSLDSKITAYCISKRPVKRPAQDSPRVFYTTPPLKTSTPKGIASSDMYHTQRAKNTNTTAKQTQGTIVTTVRSGASSSSASSQTITTTTMATVKRVTRSTATGSKIIVLSKSNQSNEESILPDDNSSQQQTEIKNEKDIEEFLG